MEAVYILFSEKMNRFYIGYTADFETRMEFHKNAEKNKFTAKADDWIVYLTIECQSKKQALGIEGHIKRMKSKKYIQNLKKYPEIIEKLLEKYC